MKRFTSWLLVPMLIVSLLTGCADSNTRIPEHTDTKLSESNLTAEVTDTDSGDTDTDADGSGQDGRNDLDTMEANTDSDETGEKVTETKPHEPETNTGTSEAPGHTTAETAPVLGDNDDAFGDDLADTGIYDGYFDGESMDITVTCISGTDQAYRLDGTTLTFSGITEDSVYAVSGTLNGNIVIEVPADLEFELEMTGLSLVSASVSPIQILSGKKVTLTAKKDSDNYIYDKREAIDTGDENATKSAIHSVVDLQIGGRGTLSVVSEKNNGIHTKDDLEVKNLTLTVACQDNALKGNDSVVLNGGTVTLIAKEGDGIKTTASDISAKGNQRGTVRITETKLTVYAACDGIDAAYNAVIDGDATSVSIYTDKYSSYSDEVTDTAESVYYIRFTSDAYQYAVKYANSESEFEWVTATYHSKVSGGWSTYYYYTFPKKTEYSQMQFFIYDTDMEPGQEEEYLVASDYLAPNTTYDTFALSSRGNSLTYTWTNYTTNVQGGGWGGGPGGFGGMGDGNSDKGDHSTKGIKAANEIIITGGNVQIKAYDDALHADNSVTLENGETALGNITVTGGHVTLYSNDDGIHAENAVYMQGGTVNIENSYEGIEGREIFISGGNVSVDAKDDGMNSTATSGTGVTLSGGYLYIYCTGDGIDCNSRTAYAGISFEGGDAVIISNSGMNSAIDTEKGYKYTAGSVVAIMPSGGMSSEAKHCENFSSIGTSQNMSLSSGSTLTISGDMNKTVTMPCSINGLVIILNRNVRVEN